MNSRTKIILLIIISVLAVMFSISLFKSLTDTGFYVSTREMDTKLDDKEKLIRFEIDESAQYPYQAILNFEGYINGKGILSFGTSDSSIYVSDTIDSDFKINYRSDLYADWCIIKYIPISATNGQVKIKCEILSHKK
jgi:hypothetical protein